MFQMQELQSNRIEIFLKMWFNMFLSWHDKCSRIFYFKLIRFNLWLHNKYPHIFIFRKTAMILFFLWVSIMFLFEMMIHKIKLNLKNLWHYKNNTKILKIKSEKSMYSQKSIKSTKHLGQKFNRHIFNNPDFFNDKLLNSVPNIKINKIYKINLKQQ